MACLENKYCRRSAKVVSAKRKERAVRELARELDCVVPNRVEASVTRNGKALCELTERRM